MRSSHVFTMLVACSLIGVACGDDITQVTTPGLTVETFTATLTTGAEVPAPTIPAGETPSGTASFTALNNLLIWEVNVTGIDSVFIGHIHAGAAGAPGGVIVDLAPSPIDQANYTGTIAVGSRAVHDSVLARLRAGTAYVNLHTRRNTAGEIRGQIQQQ
ncbi:MAG TPA: CHRD domain-containing protein [Gemmatimonadales bacterium]|jgi:hypothetical protein|nr:CHRD domain-containing protein [Gemmatimonadales bacterium]